LQDIRFRRELLFIFCQENGQDRLIKGLIGYGVNLGHWDTDFGIYFCGGGVEGFEFGYFVITDVPVSL
jgi:hypothetical protein